VIPTGTGNVFARQIGVPIARPWNRRRLVAAAVSLADGQQRSIDIGRANGRYFLLWSGVGLDALVSQTIEPKPPVVRRFGLLGYAAHALAVAIRYHGQRLIIEADGERIETDALLAVASNIRAYAAILNIAPHAVLDDGRLDLTVLRGTNLPTILLHVAFLLSHTVHHDPLAIMRQVRQIQIDCAVPGPLHVDGEPLGLTPATIEVVPSALRILAPRHASRTLFLNG
jgi:diacylglycerol kinase (ATP)